MVKGSFIFYKFFPTLILLICGIVFSACNELLGEKYYSIQDSESLELRISLNAVEEHYPRAINDQDPLYDSYINHRDGDFRILIYTSDLNLLTVLTNRELQFNENNVSDWYTLDYNVGQDSPEIYIVALLNWNSINSEDYYPSFNSSYLSEFMFPELEDLWTDNREYNLATSDNKSWYPSIEAKKHIPMFGFTKINIEEKVIVNLEGKRTLHVTVPSMRSLAKISFEVSDELYAKGFDISDCSISNYNASGFFIPDMSVSGNSFNENGDLIVTEVSCPTQIRVATALHFTNMGETYGKKKWVVYLPEMDNSDFTTKSDGRPVLKASLSYDKVTFDQDKTIELAYYSDDGYLPDNSPLYNVIRNNYYAYTIVDIDENQNIKLKYTVCPWIDAQTEIEFN